MAWWKRGSGIWRSGASTRIRPGEKLAGSYCGNELARCSHALLIAMLPTPVGRIRNVRRLGLV